MNAKPWSLNIDWDAQPFGEVPDAELAARLGCSVSTIAMRRRQRGILLRTREGGRQTRAGKCDICGGGPVVTKFRNLNHCETCLNPPTPEWYLKLERERATRPGCDPSEE